MRFKARARSMRDRSNCDDAPQRCLDAGLGYQVRVKAGGPRQGRVRVEHFPQERIDRADPAFGVYDGQSPDARAWRHLVLARFGVVCRNTTLAAGAGENLKSKVLYGLAPAAGYASLRAQPTPNRIGNLYHWRRRYRGAVGSRARSCSVALATAGSHTVAESGLRQRRCRRAAIHWALQPRIAASMQRVFARFMYVAKRPFRGVFRRTLAAGTGRPGRS